MPAPQFDQDTRHIAIETPLGRNKLLLAGFSGHEELSRLFRFDLDLRSPDNAIKFEDLVGKNVTVSLKRPDGGKRYFNGFISRMVQVSAVTHDEALASYRAELVPWLWLLTRTADCRIFQNKAIPDIVKQVCADNGFTDIELRLSGAYSPWDYCVQYRETDFNFVSRLMEQEGIGYFFLHEEGKLTLVLCDSPGSHQPYSGYGKIKFRAFSTAAEHGEEILGWTIEKQIQPGQYSHADYNFETPATKLLNTEDLSRSHAMGNLEIYDYPGEFEVRGDGEAYGKIRIQELQAQYERHLGNTNSRGIHVGHKFSLEDHPRGDQNKNYLVFSSHISARTGAYDSDAAAETCDCSFVAIDGKEHFRPARSTPKPIIQGSQTAVVVGPAGEEIHPDKYGRVKVQFHWDRLGRSDANSSCWIRVSSPWVGKQWGFVAIPRMGQEVVVSFLEGDPDQPLITGMVYNAANMPPYELPANKTQSGIKTRSTKGGSPANFNELRFEDKKGSEQLFIHAEKNQDIEVENDETHWVGHDRRKTIDHDETSHIKHDRTETVDNNETIAIGNNRTETVGSNETISIEKNRTESVGKDETISIGGNRTEDVTKDETITISENRTEQVGKDEKLQVGGNRTDEIGKDDKQQIGKKFALVAGDEIVLKTGDASLTMKKDGTITLKGKDITVNGSGKVNVKASSDVVIKGQKVTAN